MKMEAIRSLETPVNFHHIARRYISEGKTVDSHHCENLKSNVIELVFLSKPFTNFDFVPTI
jgi:hypothetical protein